MKILHRFTFVLLILTISTFLAHGQESDMSDRTFRLGLEASPNLGWIRPGIQAFEKSGLDSRIGFGYGLMVDIKFSQSPNYLFSTGVNIVTQGGSLTEPYDSLNLVQVNDSTTTSNYYYGKAERSYGLQYVTIPLHLKMRTNTIGYLSYFGSIGLDLGIRTRAFVNDSYTWNDPTFIKEDKDINLRSQTNLFRLGLNLTLGAEFNISGNTNAYMGIGWHNGLTNVFKKDPSTRILKPDEDGIPVLENGVAVPGRNKKATTNYVSINFGIFF